MKFLKQGSVIKTPFETVKLFEILCCLETHSENLYGKVYFLNLSQESQDFC